MFGFQYKKLLIFDLLSFFHFNQNPKTNQHGKQ